MSKELEKNYNPSEIEDRLYHKWLEKKYFHAEVNRDKKPFTIVMPPPNITGKLHMGHALDNTMQDIIIRFKRMQGYEALWIPGTDHASISTEVKVTNALKEEGIDKHELGREGFLKRTWEWKKEYGGTITSQLKKIGSSCDWDRERFTMDEGCSKAVQEVFIKLYEKGLIYKGSRIVNWCPVCNTSISDAEVEHEEQAGHFWHINYPVVGEPGRYVEIATTRPETLLGDSALAVNPDDERYTDLVGKEVELPLTDRTIPIIADPYVDKEFGTGVVKITPAHDPNDFEVGKRHNLPEINILNDDATINNLGGKYAGMDRYEARKAMVADLDALGLLVRVEDHTHNVGTHDRCKTTVEPMIKQQWFVKMDELIKPAVEGVKNGDIELIPASMDKTYYNWTDNIRDWCISRQLWWGHRIPAYYCKDCGEMTVSREAVCTCPKCGAPAKRETDTMPQWAGSSWYFLRYMDPHNNKALVDPKVDEYWKNVDLYVGGTEHATGHLIYSRFWNKFLHDVGASVVEEPFQKLVNQGMIQGRSNFVYRIKDTHTFVSLNLKDQYEVTPLHVDVNIVSNDILDLEAFKAWRPEYAEAEFILEDGKYICGWAVEKMSKSMFNVVNPDMIVEKYGADTLRMYEMFLGPVEQSKPWDTNGIDGVHRFIRKFWSLFYNRTDEYLVKDEPATKEELKSLHKLIKKVTGDIEQFSYNTSVSAFMICVNELSNLKCNKKEILEQLVITLAPFAPHVCEELWDTLGHETSVCDAAWPAYNEEYLKEDTINYTISFNGKARFNMEFDADAASDAIQAAVLADERSQKWIEGKTPKKIIVVPKKIVNVVV